ncbi:hypothetical protein HPP92_025829 [Vanilla planifolia]|uniref:Uncharacterized protein n=1 Tax=Vanilla planifolia TaxID=51239 RepID=A0A835PHY6_VANPL|nr:hypothetical protein HPP92_025829 [Vanilla planifolia]
MTPAAMALMKKKKFVPCRKKGTHFPTKGRQEPTPPATRMEKMAAILSGLAWNLLPSSSVASHPQSPRVWMGRKKKIGTQKTSSKGFVMVHFGEELAPSLLFIFAMSSLCLLLLVF